MEVVDTRQVLQLEQEQVLQQEVEVLQEQEQEHFHVLAVDDSVIDRKLLERLLRVRASSCKVTCVDSGDKALKYLGLNNNNNNNPSATAAVTSLESPLQQDHQGIKVNMIMTDYCMPGMSGYDLLKRVKGSSWKDVPVVVMSSENVPSRIKMCLEGGAEEFLLKPLQLSDLEKLQPYFLKTVLDNSSSSDDQESSSANSNNASTDSDSTDDSSITISKRKADVSPEPPERSRPKIKGLAVLGPVAPLSEHVSSPSLKILDSQTSNHSTNSRSMTSKNTGVAVGCYRPWRLTPSCLEADATGVAARHHQFCVLTPPALSADILCVTL